MRSPVTIVFPAYAPRAPRWKAAPALVAVLLLHAAIAAVVQTAVQPARPLAMPADPAAPLMVLILPERGAGTAHVADMALPANVPPPLAPVRSLDGASDERVREAAVDTRYLPSGKLDIGPVPAGAPDFAAATHRTLSIGKVALRVFVSAFGLPDRVEILGLPLDEDFAQALRRALEQTTFLPGRLGGHDVAAYVDYEFQTEVVILTPPPSPRSS